MAKLGITTAFFQNYRAGTWVYTWNLLKAFDALGDPAARVCTLDLLPRSVEGLRNIPHVTYSFPNTRLAKLFWPNFILPRQAAADGFDLVHVTTPYGTFTPCRYRNVITVCDMTPLLFPGTHGRMNVWHHRFVLPAILRRADRVITISESSKYDIVRLCGVPDEKVVVTNLAADPAFCSNPPGVPSPLVAGLPRPYVLNVGTLEPRKNLEGLLRGYAAARKLGLPHTLVVTGAKGWGKSRLAATVRELRLEGSVVFTGFVPDADLPHLYAGAEFFVYPSLYEGFGLPPLEAMACGTPVITSNVSSLPEVTGDAALLVDPRSEAELAAAILRLAGDRDLCATLRERGMRRAGLFSWQRTAAETWAVYEDVMGRGLGH